MPYGGRAEEIDMSDDFDKSGMVFPCRMRVMIVKVRVPRWPAFKRMMRHVLRRNWRGVAAAWQVVRTGKDNLWKGTLYGWTE